MSGKESNTASRVILFCGSDEFQMAESARAAVNRLCPPAQQALGLETIEGDVETIDDAIALARRCLLALQTVGFFGATKTVWLRNATFLGEPDLLKHDLVKPRLDEVLDECKGGLLPGVHFIISSSSVDGRTSLFKTLQAIADVQKFDLPDKQKQSDETTRDFIESQLDKAGLTARHEVVDALAARCGGSREIAGEIEKLALYAMPRTLVTMDDVHAVVSSSRETIGWDLADHFGKRDLRAALRALRQLLFQKESPHGMIAGLESRIRDMIILKECVQRKWARLSGGGDWQKVEWSNAPEAEALLSGFEKDPRKMNPWRSGKLAQQAGMYTLDELKTCHRESVATHERMVSTPVPAELLLELFLVRTIGAPKRAPS